MKRYFTSEQYGKIGKPDLGVRIRLKIKGEYKNVLVVSVHFTGEKSRHKGKIELGIHILNKR